MVHCWSPVERLLTRRGLDADQMLTCGLWWTLDNEHIYLSPSVYPLLYVDLSFGVLAAQCLVFC